MSYLNPQDVTAPRDQWEFTATIYDTGEHNHSVVLGTWEGTPCLASRWNGCLESETSKKGNPISSFQPTWFILPHLIAHATFRELVVRSAEGDTTINREALEQAAVIFTTNQ
jgi:hypothetical protein